MKIAHVIDYFHTDVGYQEYYLALVQAAHHEVRVITTTGRHHTVGPPGPDDRAGAARLDAGGVDVVRLPSRDLRHDRSWLLDLECALDSYSPDAIHCHGPFAPTTVRVARWTHRTGATLLVDNHIQEFIAPGAKSFTGRAFYGAFRAGIAPWLRRRVNSWVAIGPYEADFLAERMNLDRSEIELIPLGFDPEIFVFDETRRAQLRSERGWDGDLVVAVTGKLHRGKATDVTARAVDALVASRSARLVLAGSIAPDYLRDVRRAAPRLAATDRLTVLPMLGRSELADLYLAADVVVFARLPSISIYEAAGTGVDVLVGRDEFSSWLEQMHAGIRTVDLADLVGALDDARGDRSQRATAAAAVFAWDVISAHFVRRYRAAS